MNLKQQNFSDIVLACITLVGLGIILYYRSYIKKLIVYIFIAYIWPALSWIVLIDVAVLIVHAYATRNNRYR